MREPMIRNVHSKVGDVNFIFSLNIAGKLYDEAVFKDQSLLVREKKNLDCSLGKRAGIDCEFDSITAEVAADAAMNFEPVVEWRRYKQRCIFQFSIVDLIYSAFKLWHR